MHKLVFYDIESDKLRTKISQDLEQFGLIRIQKSVFLGHGNASFWKKLKKRTSIRLPHLQDSDSICFIELNSKAIDRAIIYGNPSIFEEWHKSSLDFWLI